MLNNSNSGKNWHSEANSSVRNEYKKLANQLKKLNINTNYWNWELASYLTNSTLGRILALNKIFHEIQNIHGSILEIGCHCGSSSLLLSNLRTLYEPYNSSREFHLFDTFTGIPNKQSSKDLKESSFNFSLPDGFVEDLEKIIYSHKIIQKNAAKTSIIKVHNGNIENTLPKFIKNNPHLIASLVIIDLDLYEPTIFAIKAIKSLLKVGSIVAIGGINSPYMPGSTHALKETFLNNCEIINFPFTPYLGYIRIKEGNL